jgi:SpoVK/Ycf46/Vps4 family AAA+-type ATPase
MQYTPPVKTPSSLAALWVCPKFFNYSRCAAEAMTCENQAAAAGFEDRLAMLERAQCIWHYVIANSSGTMRQHAADRLNAVSTQLQASKDAMEAARAVTSGVAPPTPEVRPRPTPSPTNSAPPVANAPSTPVVGTRMPPPPLAPAPSEMDVQTLIQCSSVREAEAVALCEHQDYAAARVIYAELAGAWARQARVLGAGAMQMRAHGYADTFSKSERELAVRLTKPAGAPQASEAAAQSSEIDERVMHTLLPRSALAGGPSWDSMRGMEDVKDKLLSAVADPIVFRDFYTGERRPPRGVLLYGPAGNGKTTLVRALLGKLDAMLGETRRNFFNVTGADINTKWVGDSEKFVQALFRKARELAPSLVMIDEVEAVAGDRSHMNDGPGKKVLNQFLTELDGVAELGDVMVLVTTNYPTLLDDAFKRRMTEHIYVPLPNAEGRAAMLQRKIEAYAPGHGFTPEQVRELARSKNMENFSAADIGRAVENAFRDGPLQRIRKATHFVQVNGKMHPCVADTPGCVQGTWMSFGANAFADEPFTYEDLQRALRNVQPTAVGQIKQCEAYQQSLLQNKE